MFLGSFPLRPGPQRAGERPVGLRVGRHDVTLLNPPQGMFIVYPFLFFRPRVLEDDPFTVPGTVPYRYRTVLQLTTANIYLPGRYQYRTYHAFTVWKIIKQSLILELFAVLGGWVAGDLCGCSWVRFLSALGRSGPGSVL